MAFDTEQGDKLVRDKFYEATLIEEIAPQLLAMNYVDDIPAFSGKEWVQYGTEMTNPIKDYKENDKYTTTTINIIERTFDINQFKQGGFAVTDKMREDAPESIEGVINKGIKDLSINLMQELEGHILSLIKSTRDAAPTKKIKGYSMYFAAGKNKTTNTVGTITPSDMNYAATALKTQGYTGSLVGITSFEQNRRWLEDVSFANNYSVTPRFEGLILDGVTAKSGVGFLGHYSGVDWYGSNYLPVEDTLSQKLSDGTAVTLTGDYNVSCVFSNEPSRRPFTMSWKRMPKMSDKYDQETETTKYFITSRYGVKNMEVNNLVAISAAQGPDAASA